MLGRVNLFPLPRIFDLEEKEDLSHVRNHVDFAVDMAALDICIS